MMDEQRNAIALLFLHRKLWPEMGAAKKGLKCELSG